LTHITSQKMQTAIFHFSNISTRLLEEMEINNIKICKVSIPNFAATSIRDISKCQEYAKVTCDIHHEIQDRALSFFRLNARPKHTDTWSWEKFSPNCRKNCYVQLRKYNFILGMSDTEKFLFIDCIVNACLDIALNTKIDIALWGIIPHSLYDYALMCTLKYLGKRQLIFQEFSYCISGSFQYSDELEIAPPKSTKSLQSVVDIRKESQLITDEVLLRGKAALCDTEIATGAVRSYVPSGFEIDLAKSYLTDTNPMELEQLKTLEEYYLTIGGSLSLAETETDLQNKIKILHMKGYLKFAVLYLCSEPELTISPMSGGLTSNFEFIYQLLNYLPHDCGLLIKEHPGMILERLAPNRRAWTSEIEQLRPKRLLDIINKQDRIEWCPISASLSDLKDLNVCAIATAAGTVGFESVILGIPVVCSASVPYSTLPCVQRINNQSEETFNNFINRAKTYLEATSPVERAERILSIATPVASMIANGELYAQSYRSKSLSEKAIIQFILEETR
jgi:hypothetical protein